MHHQHPLRHQRRRLHNYVWTNDAFVPPDSKFRGKLMELPEDYEVPLLLHFFLTDGILELLDLVNMTNIYKRRKQENQQMSPKKNWNRWSECSSECALPRCQATGGTGKQTHATNLWLMWWAASGSSILCPHCISETRVKKKRKTSCGKSDPGLTNFASTAWKSF